MLNVIVMQFPRAMDDFAVLVDLLEASGGRPSVARCGATGMMFVAPSDSQMPVPANETCIMCFAKSHAACSMCWCAAVMLQLAV